jgi:hypothetical protein
VEEDGKVVREGKRKGDKGMKVRNGRKEACEGRR